MDASRGAFIVTVHIKEKYNVSDLCVHMRKTRIGQCVPSSRFDESFPRAEMKHKMNPVMDAQLNRNRQRQRGHRRNLSDGRISSATEHLGEDVSHRI